MTRIAWVLLVVVITGCASAPKSKFDLISTQTAQVLQGTGTFSVDVVPGKGLAHYTGAEQAMMTAGVLFGAIGGAIGAMSATASANKRGTTLTTTSGMSDPSQAVAEKMRQRLLPERLTKNGAENRLVLNTTNWVMNQGNLSYFVQMRMIDAASSRVMTKGECKYFRKAKEVGVSNDALLADSAARLKQEYDRAADYCASYFIGKLFPDRGHELNSVEAEAAPTRGHTSTRRGG